jgi:type IV pilus assembly protein PilA
VLIIGILIAIALPTFLGARERAENRAAQSSLRNTVAAAKTYFTDDDSYTGFDAAAAQAIEPSLTYTDAGPSTGPTNVHIVEADVDDLLMLALSDSGVEFGVSDRSGAGGPGTRFCSEDDGVTVWPPTTASDCAQPSW